MILKVHEQMLEKTSIISVGHIVGQFALAVCVCGERVKCRQTDLGGVQRGESARERE